MPVSNFKSSRSASPHKRAVRREERCVTTRRTADLVACVGRGRERNHEGRKEGRKEGELVRGRHRVTCFLHFGF